MWKYQLLCSDNPENAGRLVGLRLSIVQGMLTMPAETQYLNGVQSNAERILKLPLLAYLYAHPEGAHAIKSEHQDHQLAGIL